MALYNANIKFISKDRIWVSGKTYVLEEEKIELDGEGSQDDIKDCIKGMKDLLYEVSSQKIE